MIIWVDDFAATRNAALARETGDYAFWLDADDVVEPDELQKLQSLLGGLRRIAQCDKILSATFFELTSTWVIASTEIHEPYLTISVTADWG